MMLYFDENHWHHFGTATYRRKNTQYKGFEKIYSKHREEKKFLSVRNGVTEIILI
jgi:hypothetical protein